MACYQSSSIPSGVSASSLNSYSTEADCLNACKEGACCDGTTCSVKPQCQCQGTGQFFGGVGTTCETVDCCCTSAESWQIVFFARPVSSATGCGCDKLSVDSDRIGTPSYYTTLSNGSEVCIMQRPCGQFATLALCRDYGANIVGRSIGPTLRCPGFPTVPWGRTIGYDAGPDGDGYPTQFDCIQCTPNPLP
jgi:hypothetical protein